MDWYPLKFSTHVRNYSFGGGQNIARRLGKENLPEGIVAETWEISDYKDTSGTVSNGTLSGTKFHDLVLKHPEDLVGKGWSGPHFPLLEKFLDATHTLPLHLHADDETARCKYCEPNGKTEAWHIIWAEPGASILLGVKPGQKREALFNAFKEQDYDSVVPRYPIKAGDTIYVPAGVLHNFGPNTLVYEVQQTSDLAQTVMPTDLWGNVHPVEVWEKNINATLDEMHPEFAPKPNPGLIKSENGNKYLVCCAGPYFAMERWSLKEPHSEPAHAHRCLTIANVGDPVTIVHDGHSESLGKGESCLIPAAMGEFRIQGKGDLLVCYVPDLDNDIRKPLSDKGFRKEEIAALGQA